MTPRGSAILIIASITLTFATLGVDSVWLDEAFSVGLATDYTATEFFARVLDARHPPLFYALLRQVVGLLGASEWAVRLPSALGFVITVVLTAVLARRLGLGRQTALTAALLVALAPLQVWYAQEARMYALVTTAALVFAVGLTIDSLSAIVVMIAGLTGGLFLDFTMVPLAAALLALWLARWWTLERTATAVARVAVAVVLSVWLARALLPQLAGLLGDLSSVPSFAALRAVIGLPPLTGTAYLLAMVAIVMAIATTSAWALGRRGSPTLARYAGWVVPAVFCVATALSALPRAYGVKQMLTTGWPYVAIATAWALEIGRSRRWLSHVTIALSVVAMLITLATPRADWRGVVAYLNQSAAPGEIVWLDPHWNSLAYDFYAPRIQASEPGDNVEPHRDAVATAEGIWIVAERFGRPAPSSPSEAWLDKHATLKKAVAFARLELRLYDARGLARY